MLSVEQHCSGTGPSVPKPCTGAIPAATSVFRKDTVCLGIGRTPPTVGFSRSSLLPKLSSLFQVMLLVNYNRYTGFSGLSEDSVNFFLFPKRTCRKSFSEECTVVMHHFFPVMLQGLYESK